MTLECCRLERDSNHKVRNRGDNSLCPQLGLKKEREEREKKEN